MNTRCGPKSKYSKEQEQWLDEAIAEFLPQLETKHELHWEAKWKKAKVKEFVHKFASSIDGELELWEKVRIYLTNIYPSLMHKVS